MMTAQQTETIGFPIDQVFWAVGSLAQIHQIPFDSELMKRSSAPPYSLNSIAEILARFGLAAKLGIAKPGFKKARFPLLIELRADISPSGQTPPTSSPRFAIAIKEDGDDIWFFIPGSQQPQRMSKSELGEKSSGQIIECRLVAEAADDPDQKKSAEFGFAWFIPVVFRHKAIWRDVLIASLVIQLIALATPLFTQVVIDKVVVHQTMSTLIVIAVGLVVFMLFNAVLTWVRQYLILHTGNRVDAQLGSTVFEHLLSLPLNYFEHRPTGVIAARLHGVETIREFIASSIVTLILDLPFLLIFVGIMFYYSVPLTLMVLAILGLIVVMSLAVAPAFRKRLNQQFLLGARNQAFVTEYVASLETVKSLQMEPQLAKKWREYLATYLEAGFHTRQIGNTYNVASNMLEQLMTLAVLTIGAWTVMSGSLGDGEKFTIGMLVAFQMFSGKLSQPVLRLVGLWQQFQQASISVKRLADIMNAPPEPYSLSPNRQVKREGRVEIIDLAFRYAQDRPYLYQHLNITLKPGKTSVLVGPSGSGKSTLAKLMQGFYLPAEGQIRIDGVDIRHLAANELRSYFGVVPQETSLFSGTIYNNLVIANPYVNFDQVVQACKMAEIHAVIDALPNGYQTEIGERGAGLSGGQKQRLAIARALLKRPKILIFDEATSALDSETAEHFAATVNALRGKVAMLFITHQLPQSLLVDEVITLGDKRLSVVGGQSMETSQEKRRVVGGESNLPDRGKSS